MNLSTVSILLGSGVYGTALAASAGPSWEMIGVGAVGLVFAIGGAYVKGLAGRVSDVERDVRKLNDAILREYHPKPDIEKMVNELRESLVDMRDDLMKSIEKVEKKMDKFESLYGR